MTSYWTGKKRSPETNEKIRLSLLGRKRGPHSELTRKKIGDAHRGRKTGPMSKEQKIKISVANKGRKVSQKTAQKISNALVGKYVGEKSKLWKGGQPKCIDCKKTISWRSKRCQTCAYKIKDRYIRKSTVKWTEETKIKYQQVRLLNGKTVQVQCDYCRKIFYRANSLQKTHKSKKPRKNTFCSLDCYAKWLHERKTEDHPLYRGIGDKNTKLYTERAKLKDPVGFRQKKSFNNRLREDKKRKSGGTHTLKQWIKLKQRFNNSCKFCLRKEPEIKLCRDHIIPIAKWTEWEELNKPNYQCNDIQNIQPLCISCNCKKHTKIIT